jgi:hypothetical protein
MVRFELIENNDMVHVVMSHNNKAKKEGGERKFGAAM